ncbi:MAG: SpaA isopeptide-forming pilin-related protein, partial [Lachnospiraceae bacterium]|nr:SpaA isopeptide-forming pilin-related protein [Lachnospiraceae bacterium]
YDQDDVKDAEGAVKEFVYYVEEVKPAEENEYTYSDFCYRVTVGVQDTGKGSLEITGPTVEVRESATDPFKPVEDKKIVFTNHYNAEGKLSLHAFKKTNIPLNQLLENKFSFRLAGSRIDLTATSDELTGIAEFADISYDEDDIGATYHYVISELAGSNKGYRYSQENYLVKVEIIDNLNGTLKVKKTVTNSASEEVDPDKDGIVFENVYTASTDLELKAKKTLKGRNLDADKFEFVLSDEDGKELSVKKNTAAGEVTFDKLLYTQEDIGKTFSYTVSEKDTKEPGYQYSSDVYTVKVTISDAGNGTLKAEPVYTHIADGTETAADTMEFVNEYSAEGSYSLTANKALDASVKELKLKAKEYRFQIFENDAEEPIATGTNDEDGLITFSEIEYSISPEDNSDLGEHTYTVKEVKGGNPAIVYDTSVFTIRIMVTDLGNGKLGAEVVDITKKDRQADGIEFVNDTTKVQISKKEITGGPELPDAKLQVVKPGKDGAEDEIIEEWISGEEPHYIEAKLEAGVTYILREITAPLGYTVAADVEFTVSTDGATDVVEMIDDATVTSISKTDITTSEELPGAKLQILKKNEAGEEETATTIYYKNDTDTPDEKLEWISGEEPRVIKGLPAGDYILREITAPNGYTVAEDVAFTVSDDGTVKNKAEMKNAPIELEIGKTGFTLDGEVVPLEGAKLEIREKTENGSIGDIITNVYGEKMRFESAEKAVVLKGVKPGSYWLVETEAPTGYTVADPIEITINEDMTVSQNPLTYIMEDCPTEVSISKTDITTGKELPGASIQILKKNADGTEETATTIYYVDDESTPNEKLQWISGEEPRIIRGLPAGNYILRETTAPAGYAVAEDVEFTITDELKAETKVVMEDKPTEVTVSKRAITGLAELPGATLQVLDASGKVATTIYYVDDATTPNEKLEWVSGEEAKVIKGLKPGRYTLKETQAPDGYGIAETIEFEITEGKFSAQQVIMRDETTKVHISKMDITNKKELAGAHLILKDAQGNTVADWVSTGKPKVLNKELIAGATYTLIEISAPSGYDISNAVTFTVNTDGKIQTVVMNDEVSSGNGSITIQKLVMMDNEYTAIDYTFYVALFSDEACTQRVSSVKPLEVSGSYTTSTIFTKLKYGTYYVAETDELGNPISSGEFIVSNQIIDGKAVLTPTAATAKSTIINHVTGFNPGYYKDGKITVDKRVLINGTEGNVDDTFYFALFSDAALTNLITDLGIQELSLQNASHGTVTFENVPYGEFYLAETDENGIPVDDSFAYDVTISSYCKIDAENLTVTRTVVNSKEEEETESETSSSSTTTTTTTTGGKTTTGTKPVKTGDNTPIYLYLLLLAISAAIIGGLGYNRKRRRKDI